MTNLNPQQKEAVYSDANKIVCLAGAGAGKTFSMLARIEHIIKDLHVNPKSILVLTFTRAAALNMKQRYIKSNIGSASPEFHTFHAFCYNLLIENSEIRNKLGYSDIPVIADANQEKHIQSKVNTMLNIKNTKKKKEKDKLTPYEIYQQKLQDRALKRLMNSENMITFDSLSQSVCELFTSDDPCIQRYKQRYKYIFIDEFQDTDPTQYEFMTSFKDSSLFVVGDTLQSIYSFRNADSSIIKSLIDSEDWKTIKLYKNYRSGTAICDFANDNTKYAQLKYKVQLEAANDFIGCAELNFFYELDPDYDFDTLNLWDTPLPKFESEDLLESLKDCKGSTAILCRTNSESNSVQSLLKLRGIPFSTSNKKEDIESFLKSIFNNEYFLLWSCTFLNSKQYADYIRLCHIDDSKYTVKSFYEMYGKNIKIQYIMNTVFRLRMILANNTTPSYQKIVDCLDLLRIDYDRNTIDLDTNSNSEIVQYIEKIVQTKEESDIYVGTIHSAKGLEYDNVFVLNVDGDTFELDNEDNHNLYYVAITRAKNYLKVYHV